MLSNSAGNIDWCGGATGEATSTFLVQDCAQDIAVVAGASASMA
jgi:hypothetical protein